jgi:DNA-binding MarR family transcriptional regulator
MSPRKPNADCKELARYVSDSIGIIRKAIHEQLGQAFDAGAVTAQQRLAMQVLLREGSMSIKDFASRLSLSHSTVSALVQRLEKRGMISREVDPADARISRISPSAAVMPHGKLALVACSQITAYVDHGFGSPSLPRASGTTQVVPIRSIRSANQRSKH